MRFSAHQPHYGPWFPYLWKMAVSDVFVLMDDAQFKKGDWQNRTRIEVSDHEFILTVPLKKAYLKQINEVEVDGDWWRTKHERTLTHQYGMCWPLEGRTLNDVAMGTIDWLRERLEITTPMVRISDLDCHATGAERLYEVGDALGASQYLSSSFGLESYLDASAAPFEIVTYSVKEPEYRLSGIDVLATRSPGWLKDACDVVRLP